jgi:hypothetical protein
VGLIPIYHGVISMSSSVGNCFSNYDLIAWSKQSSMHHMGGGVMKLAEDRSTLSFDNILVKVDGSRSDP